MFLLCLKKDQSRAKSLTPKIEDLKDWLKCVGGSNHILSDHQLMFNTNFNVIYFNTIVFEQLYTFLLY